MKIEVLRDIQEESKAEADKIRKMTEKSETLVLNIMSSPGSGKTTLLKNLIPKLSEYRVGVIVGDISTTRDAEKFSDLDARIIQINTDQFGGTCHLSTDVVLPALKKIDYQDLDIIFIENVGNLVCPAHFDIGADNNIVIVSLPEGEDKPLKYPLMFRESDLAIINKIDLEPYLKSNSTKIEANIGKVDGRITIIETSATKNIGISKLKEWIEEKIKR